MMASSDEAYLSALAGFPARIKNELTILLYHGVTDSVSTGIENASGKHIHVDAFRDQMQFIKQNCNVLSMDDVVALTENGEAFPPRAVAVTFDDGFKNNHALAAPVLDELQVSATFYITAGIVDTKLMFWVDDLEDCLNLSQAEDIRILLDGAEKLFSLRSDAEKLAALAEIKGYCKRAASADKDRVLRDVATATGIVPDVGHARNYEKISWDELREMDANPLFIIAGHSLYHDILSAQPVAEMQAAVRLSLGLLSYNLGHSVTHFSYPEGQAHHYSEKVIQTLKDEGVVCSPSAITGLNPVGSDLFHLKRIMVGFDELPFPYHDPRLARG